MAITLAGDIAVLIGFAQLILSGRQAQPDVDRAELPEVVQVLDRGCKRRHGNRPNRRSTMSPMAASTPTATVMYTPPMGRQPPGPIILQSPFGQSLTRYLKQ
jgi:hypothetical protein